MIGAVCFNSAGESTIWITIEGGLALIAIYSVIRIWANTAVGAIPLVFASAGTIWLVTRDSCSAVVAVSSVCASRGANWEGAVVCEAAIAICSSVHSSRAN